MVFADVSVQAGVLKPTKFFKWCDSSEFLSDGAGRKQAYLFRLDSFGEC